MSIWKAAGLALAWILAATVPSLAAVRTQTIEYKQGDTTLEGYLAYDDALSGKRPGVLVVHEWTGLGPYVKGRAEQLARSGFVAFAADIYASVPRGERWRDPRGANSRRSSRRAAHQESSRSTLARSLQILSTEGMLTRSFGE